MNMMVWACVFTQVVLCGGAVPGLVMCVADDGHVTVEFAHEGRACSTDYVRHHGGAMAGDDGDDHDVEHTHRSGTEHAHVDGKHLTPGSHDCTDTPLVRAPAQVTARPAQASTSPPNALLHPLPLGVEPPLRLTRAAARPRSHTPPSSLRRTIVLRV